MPFVYKRNLKKRIFACLLDYAIFSLVLYLYIGFLGTPNNDGGKNVSGWVATPLVIFWLLYFVVLEGLRGATLGHEAFNLKVLTIKRDRAGMQKALLRHLLDGIDIFIYGIPALIAICNTERHQRLGDLLAGTIVVDTEDESQYREAAVKSRNSFFQEEDK